MLGRYVAGTLLILGVAMLLAPKDPAIRLPTGEPAVARPSAPRPQVTVDARPSAATPAPAEPAVAAPEPEAPSAAETESAVEAAVAEALSLDMANSVPSMDDPAGFADSFDPGLAPAPAPSEPPPPAPAAGDDRQYFVTGTRVNVREGPATSFGIVRTVDYGEAVELLSLEGENWARIRFPDGDSGYVSLRFLARDLTGG